MSKIFRFEDRTPVVVEYGFNEVTKKPFKMIYDYIGEENDTCAVYTSGDCSMQDMRILHDVKSVKNVNDVDISGIPYGN